MENINLQRYWDSTDKFYLKKSKYTKNKLGQLRFYLERKLRSWLICGFLYVKDKRVIGGWTWNDNYHLFSKLCRYKTWESVKITWWDKIRFKIVTGYKFE